MLTAYEISTCNWTNNGEMLWWVIRLLQVIKQQPRKEEVTKMVGSNTKFKSFSSKCRLLSSWQINSSIAHQNIKRPARSLQGRQDLNAWSCSSFSLAMPADLAALSALRKSLQAMITCHFPVSAKALAVARPNPEDAPVIITLHWPFWECSSLVGKTHSLLERQ